MKLVVFRGDQVETEIRLKDRAVKIGRDASNDVVLDDPQKGVSRVHCEIRSERGRFVIADLKSRNGVYLSGKRIKNTAELTLGVPVTVGPFELVLEDDVASGDFEANSSILNPTVVAVPQATSGSGTSKGTAATTSGRRSSLPPWLHSRQTQVWGATALGLLLLGGITWTVIRTVSSPPPVEVVSTETSSTTSPVDPQVDSTTSGSSADSERAERIQTLLVSIENAIVSKDAPGALGGIGELRSLDPSHPSLADFERRANELAAKPATPVEVPQRTAKPVPPPEPETPGIARRTGEEYVVYLSRVKRVQNEYAAGNTALGKEEFTSALAHFQSVQKDQPKYQNVEQLIADATEKRRVALNEALDGGQKNEAAGNLKAARSWYQRAVHVDASSAQANEKLASVTKTVLGKARELLNTAGYHKKTGSRALATKYYQDAKALVEPTDTEHAEADRGLEELKK